MKMELAKNQSDLMIKVEGRLDTMTAPELEKKLKENLDEVTKLVFDFEELVYISSAGLRVLLSTQKAMNAKKGSMVIRHVNEEVMDVFEVTGFSDILTIEN